MIIVNQRKGLVMREIRMDEMAQSIELLNYVFQMSLSIKKIANLLVKRVDSFMSGML